MKLSRSILALALLLPLAACSDDDATGPEGNTIVGSWTVTSMEGVALPYTESEDLGDGFVCAFTISAMEVTFTAAGSITVKDTSNVKCTGEPDFNSSGTATGTYSVNGDRVTLTFTEDGETETETQRFSISGNTLTVFQETTGSATAIVAVRK